MFLIMMVVLMRPDRDQYFMELAKVAATRTTCIRRGVGCVLVDAQDHVLSIGYNGVSSGMPHCNEKFISLTQGPADLLGTYPYACIGHDLPPGQDSCEAVHAEQNALLQCHNPWKIAAAYVTLSPCKPCLKLLLNTPCQRIVFAEEHIDQWAKKQWLKVNREWYHLKN
jgi:dCMP deaminase